MESNLPGHSARSESSQEQKSCIREGGTVNQQLLPSGGLREQQKYISRNRHVTGGGKDAGQAGESGIEVQSGKDDEKEVPKHRRRCQRPVRTDKRCVDLQKSAAVGKSDSTKMLAVQIAVEISRPESIARPTNLSQSAS